MKIKITLFLFLVLLTSCKENEDSITGIPLEGDRQIYALAGYNQVESFAKSIVESLKLMRVYSNNVKSSGSAKSWHYEFVSIEKDSLYFFTRTFDSVGFDSTNIIMIGNSIITKPWIESNVALASAEMNGGSIFRNNHSDCTIYASLAEPLIPDSIPLWYINYSSANDKLYLMINAITGEFISN